MFLNYSKNLGLNIRSYRNNGYACENIEEFLSDIIDGNECTIDTNIDSIINALQDGEFLGNIGMEIELAENLHTSLEYIKKMME